MKRYKASAVLRLLSLGFCRDAISIAAGRMRSTYALFSFKPMEVEDITTIRYREVEHYDNEGGTFKVTYYEFFVKNEKPRLIVYYVLDGDEMQQLLKDLKTLNPKIYYPPELQVFINTPIQPYKIHFDFKPINQKNKEEREAKVSLEFRLQHPSKEVAHLWLTLLLGAIPFFVIMPFWIWWGQIFKGVSIWISSFFITLSIVAFSIVMFHLGMALYGLYEGKQKLLKYVYIGVFCWFFALFLELLMYFF